MPDLEEIFKGIVAIIFLVVFLGAMGPLFVQANLPDFSSFIIGFSFLFIVLVVLIKILEAFGGGHGRN